MRSRVISPVSMNPLTVRDLVDVAVEASQREVIEVVRPAVWRSTTYSVCRRSTARRFRAGRNTRSGCRPVRGHGPQRREIIALDSTQRSASLGLQIERKVVAERSPSSSSRSPRLWYPPRCVRRGVRSDPAGRHPHAAWRYSAPVHHQHSPSWWTIRSIALERTSVIALVVDAVSSIVRPWELRS